MWRFIGALSLLPDCSGGQDGPIVLDEAFDRLVVDVDGGHVALSATTDGSAAVSRTVEKGGQKVSLAWDLADGTLWLSAACEKADPAGCDVVHTIDVPAEVAVEVRVGVGGVEGWALAGPVDVGVGEGAVHLTWSSSPHLVAVVGAGDVTVDAVSVGAIDVTVGQGAAELLVPQGTYAVDAWVGEGTVEVSGVLDDPSAAASLAARSGAGSVTVAGY
jgi:hypothetical protein